MHSTRHKSNGHSGASQPNRKTVELDLAVSYGHSRRDLLGIAKYSRINRDWEFCAGPRVEKLAVASLPTGRPHGIITQISHPKQIDRLTAANVPVVNISGAMEGLPFPVVRVDDHAVGRLAAQHLLQRGFSRFAMVDVVNKAFSNRRIEGFEATVREVNPHADCQRWALEYVSGMHISRHREKLRQQLSDTVPPLAIFAVTDHLAYMAMAACRDLGLRIPHDVAIIGVDNDTLTCELSAPPLTSVDINAERIGYLAAELLAGLMDSKSAPKEPVLVIPQGVVTRQSTDVLAVEDPLVADALEYIHRNATRGIQVPGVAADLDVSRRTLERRFRRALNCTPAEEIRRTRTDRAIRLLRETDMPIADVATQCGFRYAQHLAPVIQDATGLTPTEYRRESRSL